MTYLHALQYLDGQGMEDPPENTGKPPRRYDQGAYTTYRSTLCATEPRFLYLLFAADHQGFLCAAYCRSALMAAGICVGEIGDRSSGELSEVLRINGAPVSPAVLRELCHTARATEQRRLRSAAKAAALQESNETPTHSAIFPVDGAQRCAAVLPRLFADAGCRVILLIGKVTDPRLRSLASTAPACEVAVLSASEHKPLQKFPAQIGEVICPTCSSTVFRRVTDACARAGSRLTLTATSHLKREPPSPFSQTFSYRTLSSCTLRCGTTHALRTAMLAMEALRSLERLGCAVSPQAMRQGFGSVSLPLLFSPLSIRPLLIAHAIHDEDDIDTLQQTLEEFDHALPHPRMLLCDESLSDAECDRLAALGTPISLRESALPDALIPRDITDGAPTPTYILLGKQHALERRIALWEQKLRPL